jgi:hypothetical protein
VTDSLSDIMRAYVKASGIFMPTRYVWRPFGELLEVDRCTVDGELVTNSQRSLSRHGGHHMKSPTKISLGEMVAIWVRVIR